MNLVDKGLKFPNGLFAPSYVVSNTFGEKEKEQKKDTWLSMLPFHIPPTNDCNVNTTSPSQEGPCSFHPLGSSE